MINGPLIRQTAHWSKSTFFQQPIGPTPIVLANDQYRVLGLTNRSMSVANSHKVVPIAHAAHRSLGTNANK